MLPVAAGAPMVNLSTSDDSAQDGAACDCTSSLSKPLSDSCVTTSMDLGMLVLSDHFGVESCKDLVCS
jgi:hypothetical protein